MKYCAICLLINISFSTLVHANDQLTDPERSAVSLLVSIVDIVSSKIDASSCGEMRGQYPLQLFATGVAGQRRQNNMATVKLPDHNVSVIAYLKNKIPDVGSQIITAYARTSDYDVFDPVKDYDGIYSFNPTGDLVTMTSNFELFMNYSYLKTQTYSSTAITSFSFKESTDPYEMSETNIGWGMSQLSKVEYPKFKYWQRLKIVRDDGANASTIYLKDLLANRQTCRIKTEIIGQSSMDFISQEGYLTVDLSSPTDPVVLSFE